MRTLAIAAPLRCAYPTKPCGFVKGNIAENKELLAQRKGNPFSLTSNGFTITQPSSDEEGKQFKVEPFLPEASASPYINIKPGDLENVNVFGINTLSGDAKDIHDILHSKLLHFRILAETTTGDEIWSPDTPFRERIGDEDAAQIQSRVGK